MEQILTNRKTAILAMAVLFLGLTVIGGCVTKRDIEDVKMQIREVEAQNRETQDMVSRMDSLIAAGVQSDTELKAELRASVNTIERQISQLLENYNQLVQSLNELNQNLSTTVRRGPLQSSPGSQGPVDVPPTGGEVMTEPPGWSQEECEAAYDDAFILVRKSDYEAAIESFGTFLENCPRNENVDNAHYWIGECYYSMEQFTQAVEEFEKLLNDYPGSKKIAPALYKLARSNQELGNTAEAKTLYQRIVEEHDGTLEAEQARQRLKDLG